MNHITFKWMFELTEQKIPVDSLVWVQVFIVYRHMKAEVYNVLPKSMEAIHDGSILIYVV